MELKELREKSKDKLQDILHGAQTELLTLRFSQSSGQLKRVREIRRIRQQIARILTVLKEKHV